MKTQLTAFSILIMCSASGACPKGANDPQLTFDQVMLNFSSFLPPAESAAQNGANSPLSVSNSDLQDAVKGIAATLECAQEVMADTTGQLYPPQYFALPAAQQPAYLSLFHKDMGNFEQGVQLYLSLFQALAAEAAQSRNFTAVNNQTQTVEDLGTQAHQDLQQARVLRVLERHPSG
jgi:hypothetical protein